jgi:hypothetical protein
MIIPRGVGGVSSIYRAAKVGVSPAAAHPPAHAADRVRAVGHPGPIHASATVRETVRLASENSGREQGRQAAVITAAPLTVVRSGLARCVSWAGTAPPCSIPWFTSLLIHCDFLDRL